MKFTIEKDGKIIECEILFTFHDDSNDLNYIVYTDGTKDIDNELEILAARYKEIDKKYVLEDIKNDFEWNLIDNMIESYFEEAK